MKKAEKTEGTAVLCESINNPPINQSINQSNTRSISHQSINQSIKRRSESYIGARLWYRSWPAVSQISNLTVVSSKHTVCVKKAAPIVDSWYSWKCPLTKRSTRLLFPTRDEEKSAKVLEEFQFLLWILLASFPFRTIHSIVGFWFI